MEFQVERGSRVGRFLILGAAMLALAALVATAGERGAWQRGATAPASAELDADDTRLPARALELRQGGRLRLRYLDLEGDGAPVTLELKRFRVFAPDARVVVNGTPSEIEAGNAYYRGTVDGDPESVAVLSFRERGDVRGLIVHRGQSWSVANRAPGTDAREGLKTRRMEPDGLEKADSAFRCETEPVPVDDAMSLSSAMTSESAGGGAEVVGYTARVAVETDYEFSTKFASLYEARDYIGDVFAYVSTIYEAEIDTALVVNYVSLWTVEDDPYRVDPRGTCGDLLMQFKEYWGRDREEVDRSIAHMISGTVLNCGQAELAALCMPANGYGISSPPAFTFDINDPVPTRDIKIVAHEIGHNFGSRHTHCYEGIGGIDDAVDHCRSGEGLDCYTGPTSLPCEEGPGAACGTIMSYCDWLSGGMGNVALTFGTNHPYGVAPWRVPQVMTDHVQVSAATYPGCLDPILQCADSDADDLCDIEDNCPFDANPDQADADADGRGDVCDLCPTDAGNDPDGDGVCAAEDTCPGFDDGLDCNGNGLPDGCELWNRLTVSAVEPGAQFGRSVSLDGDTAVVGAPLDDVGGLNSGAAYVFRKEGSGWVEEQELTASDGASTQYFGRSVTILGDRIVVGAPFDGENGARSGAAYVFRHDGARWIEEAKLLAGDGAASDYFGDSVSLDGDRVIVGAYAHGDTDAGAAYVFRYDGAAWIQEAKLSGSGEAGAWFGRSVSIDGDRVVVGADGDDEVGQNAGAAHVFVSDGGTWLEETKLTVIGSSRGFGRSVSVREDLILVGAYMADSVHVYRLSPNGWVQEQQLIPEDADRPKLSFGDSVSVGDGVVAVGASKFPGSAYVFSYDSGAAGWVSLAKIEALDTARGFGSSIALVGDSLMIGAFEDSSSGTATGAAYVFDFAADCNRDGQPDACQRDTDSDGLIDACDPDSDGDGIADADDVCPFSDVGLDCNGNGVPDGCDVAGSDSQDKLVLAAGGDGFGQALTIKGDWVVVGATGDDDRGQDAGAAYVLRYDQTTRTLIHDSKLTARDGWTADGFGSSVSIDGDRLVVGARWDDHYGGTNAGSAYVFYHDGTNWIQETKLIGTDSRKTDFFGHAVSIDGLRLVVGAYRHEGARLYSGAAYVFHYDGTDWVQQPKLTASDAGEEDYFGNSVAIRGDLLVIGAEGSAAHSGAAYVFRYDGAAWNEEAKLVPGDPAAGKSFGASVSILGDVVVVGAPYDDVAGTDSGSAYVFRYDDLALGWGQEAKLVPAGSAASDRFGVSVSLGDDRVVIGANRADAGWQDAGAAFVFRRDAGTGEWVQESRLTAADPFLNDEFGSAVAIDGEQVLVGAPLDDDGGTDSGSAYLFTLGASSDCDVDGVPDECQPDGDTDGVPDVCDPCPADAAKTAFGVCGCGIADEDLDGEGTIDCIQGPASCRYDVTGQYHYDSDLGRWVFEGDGVITYDTSRQWYVDDTLACYRTSQDASYYTYFSQCDFGGDGAVRMDDVYDVYYRAWPDEQPYGLAAQACMEGFESTPLYFCRNADYARAVTDIAAIKAAYPVTATIEDPATAATRGQQWPRAYDALTCGSQVGTMPPAVFDDLNACYQGTARCLDGASGTPPTCGTVGMEFATAVDVVALLDEYQAVADRYGAVCQAETRTQPDEGPLPGFHFQRYPNDTKWWLWTVRSTAECDAAGCRCDERVQVWTHKDSPGQTWLRGSTQVNAPECSDPRFGN